jgi:hypothetical protein
VETLRYERFETRVPNALALGATQSNLMISVCRQAMTPIVAGIGLAVPAVALGGRLIASQLSSVAPWNTAVVWRSTRLATPSRVLCSPLTLLGNRCYI